MLKHPYLRDNDAPTCANSTTTETTFMAPDKMARRGERPFMTENRLRSTHSRTMNRVRAVFGDQAKGIAYIISTSVVWKVSNTEGGRGGGYRDAQFPHEQIGEG